MYTLKNNKIQVIIVSILFNSIMIIYSIIPKSVVFTLLLLFLFFLFSKLIKQFKIKETLFLMMVSLLPTSFVSIFATSTSNFPFSWFHIISFILFILVCSSKNIDSIYLLLSILFLSFGFIYSLLELNFADAIKQVLTIFLFLTSFIIGGCFSKIEDNKFKLYSADILLSTCISYGFQVLIQRFVIDTQGIIVGYYRVMNGRKGYAGLMNDCSFATLFLSIGCVLALIYYVDMRRISALSFVSVEVFLLSSIICVSARTGLVALLVVCGIYILNHIKYFNKRLAFLVSTGFILIPYLLAELQNVRGQQNLMDSSGRLEGYAKAITYIKQKPIFGFGFGLNNLYVKTGLVVPHNFFIQYLLQIGIIGTIIILGFFLVYLYRHYSKTNLLRWLFWLVVSGSMVIPDISSSRFFSVVIIITMIGNRVNKKESQMQSV